MTFFAATWSRIPGAPRAVLAGFAVTLVGTLPWVLASALNTRTSPHVPWAGPLVALWLWLYWRQLAGHGQPPPVAARRRAQLQVRPLAARTWAWALLATTAGFAALTALVLAAHLAAHAIGTGAASDLSRYPLPLVVTGLVMTALVAGVSEEAGFRGVMQSALDQRFGAVASTAIVAASFALLHLSHGLAPEQLLVNAAASVLLSVTVRRCGSIVPGIVVHTASDIVVPLLVLALRREAVAPSCAHPHAAVAGWLISCAIGTACAALAAWAYVRLGRAAAGTRAG